MQIETYMSYDEVRAALGISSQELTDTHLGLDMYGDILLQDLTTVHGILSPDTLDRTLEGHYTYLKGLGTLTANQALLKSYIRLFAVFCVALNVAEALSLLAPKTISDGKALVTRFSSELTFQSVRQDIFDKRNDLLRKIKDLLGVAVIEKVYLGVVPPEIDVVTGEEYE